MRRVRQLRRVRQRRLSSRTAWGRVGRHRSGGACVGPVAWVRIPCCERSPSWVRGSRVPRPPTHHRPRVARSASAVHSASPPGAPAPGAVPVDAADAAVQRTRCGCRRPNRLRACGSRRMTVAAGPVRDPDPPGACVACPRLAVRVRRARHAEVGDVRTPTRRSGGGARGPRRHACDRPVVYAHHRGGSPRVGSPLRSWLPSCGAAVA